MLFNKILQIDVRIEDHQGRFPDIGTPSFRKG